MNIFYVGNGPSGIMLSYILSGNWPYYNGGAHPDEMLTTRLQNMPSDKSLLEQDLDMLAQVNDCGQKMYRNSQFSMIYSICSIHLYELLIYLFL